MLGRCCAVTLSLALLSPVAHADIEFFDFGLSGAQEVPSVPTPAFGVATLEFDSTTNTFDLDLFTDGIDLSSITGAHIHRAPFGQNGPVVFDLLDLGDFLDAGDGVGYLSLIDIPLGSAFTPEQLRGQLLYLNVHTRDFPTGEIRGQIPSPASIVPIASLAAFAIRRRR